MTTATLKDELGKAIGKIASGIYIVTAGPSDNKMGMLASWVMQAGFEPPMLTMAVQNDREMLAMLTGQKRCVVNVLSESNSNLMGRFAKYKPDQFEGLDHQQTDYGYILPETVAYVSCEVKEKWVTGSDHTILLAQIMDGEVLNTDLPPWTHLRKTGFSY